MISKPLGWVGIMRLGLVQMSLGAIIVLMTSTVNRVMIVELLLPSFVPGGLIALHYAVQILRPRWGHGADTGGRLTPWILGGMAVLALGGVGAALSTLVIVDHRALGLLIAIVAFLMIGVGVGACGTSLLVLLAKQTEPKRRAPAATIVWIMMIFGLAVTAGVAGHFLDPFSPERLVLVTATVGSLAMAVSTLALWGIEPNAGTRYALAVASTGEAQPATKPPFIEALKEVWAEPDARRFTIFIFVSMLAYSAQDLILEPFAGLVYALTPGQSTKLSGVQHGGALIGMVLVALYGAFSRGSDPRSLRWCAAGGCIASAVMLAAIATGATLSPLWPFQANVFALGVANGVFCIAAIGSMMAMVSGERAGREGVRMGLWGAAQGIAFGLGGLSGALAVDIARAILPSAQMAYSTVFLAEAGVFLISAWLALNLGQSERSKAVASKSVLRIPDALSNLRLKPRQGGQFP